MGTLHGGQLLAKALKQEGVTRVFTLSGDHTMPMYYGFVEEGIEICDSRHESAAVMMAAGYARATGKPAVVVVTAGPGLSNTYGAMTDVYVDGTPVLLITGGSPVAENQLGSMQEMDQLPVFRNVTQWADRVYETKRIAEYVHIAFRHMTAFGKPGPAMLEIPFDVVNDVADESYAADPGATRLAEQVVLGNPESIEKAAQLLVESKRTAMVIGRETVFYPHNQEYIGKLAEHLNILTGGLFEAKGICDETNPLHTLGMVGTAMGDVVVLVNVAPDYIFDFLNPPRFNPAAKYIIIHTDATMVGFNKAFEVGIVGTPGDVCKQLYDRVAELTPARTDFAFLQEVGAMLAPMGEASAKAAADPSVPIKPSRCVAECMRFYNERPGEYLLVTDGGDSAGGVSGPLAATKPSTMVYGGRFGAIGFGLPIAIGAHYAEGKKVFFTSGDGSIGFHMGEFATMVGRNVPIIMVIFNNSAWNQIRNMEYVGHADVVTSHEAMGFIATTLPPETRYDKMIEALGGYGEMVTDPNEIYPALCRAEASGKPACINVITDGAIDCMGDASAMFGAAFTKYLKY